MAATMVQSKAGSAASNTCTVTFDSPTTSGNLIIVCVDSYPSAAPTYTVTDNKSNTSASAVYRTQDTSRIQISYFANIAGGASHSVTVQSTRSDGRLRVHLQEWSGLATSSPLDKTASATGYSSSPSSGNTATTAQNDEALIGFAATSADVRNFTAGSGYTEVNEIDVVETSSDEYRIVTSTGDYAATFTLSATDSWRCLIATFLAAASGGATAAPLIDSRLIGGVLIRGRLVR